MEHQKYQKHRVAMIRVEPYLAAYARRKFDVDPSTGGIRIPDSFDLYHCVWQMMEIRPRECPPQKDANLRIFLPCRHTSPSKHPEYWNYIPPRKQRVVEKALRRLFNWEFHHYCEDLIARGTGKVDAVRGFIRLYGLGLDSEDALLKNLQRHERTMQAFLGISRGKNTRKRRI